MAITTASLRTTALMVVMSMSVAGLLAQTQIKRPNNRYTPQQDVELGREAAAEVRQQYPVIQDERISQYFDRLGDRLVEAAISRGIIVVQQLDTSSRTCSSDTEPQTHRKHRTPGCSSDRSLA